MYTKLKQILEGLSTGRDPKLTGYRLGKANNASLNNRQQHLTKKDPRNPGHALRRINKKLKTRTGRKNPKFYDAYLQGYDDSSK